MPVMTKKSGKPSSTRLNPIHIPSARREDQPVTRKLLYLVRDEIKSDTRVIVQKAVGESEKRLDKRFQNLDGRMSGIENRMHNIEGRMESIEGRMQSIEGRMQSIEVSIQSIAVSLSAFENGFARMRIENEEQHSNNRIVIEGIQALWQRQARLEQALHKHHD
jgi:chromosome segregation ATPase